MRLRRPIGEDRGIALEPPDRAVDAEEQLPCGFGDRAKALEAAAGVAAPEHDDRARQDDQRPADEPKPSPRPRHEAGAIHHVAEDQPVPPADHQARPEDERPVLERRQRVGDRCSAAPAVCCCSVAIPSIARMPTRMNVLSTILTVT